MDESEENPPRITPLFLPALLFVLRFVKAVNLYPAIWPGQAAAINYKKETNIASFKCVAQQLQHIKIYTWIVFLSFHFL